MVRRAAIGRTSILMWVGGVLCLFPLTASASYIAYSSGIRGLYEENQPPVQSTTFGQAEVVGGPNIYKGIGDDYWTPFATLEISEVSFYGGSDVTGMVLYIEIFNTDREVVQVLRGTMNSSEIGVKTLSFGSSFTIPGAGYIAFEPDTFGVEGPAGKFFLGIADGVDVGQNNPETSLQANDDQTTLIANLLYLDTQPTQDVDDILSFEFVGGPLVIPEPSTGMTMMLTAALLLTRRNRKTI